MNDPPKQEAHPGEKVGPATNPIASSVPPADPTPTETIADQLRRRREASLRLPPLPSGKRDPWDIERRSAWWAAQQWQESA
jgi:hypothetical protein